VTEQTDIRLARHFRVLIEDKLASGRCENPSAVVEEAVRLLERYEAQEEALARALQESLDSGEAEPFDMETWLAEQDRLDAARA
jgi:putative addiction module CopG family antidote